MNQRPDMASAETLNAPTAEGGVSKTCFIDSSSNRIVKNVMGVALASLSISSKLIVEIFSNKPSDIPVTIGPRLTVPDRATRCAVSKNIRFRAATSLIGSRFTFAHKSCSQCIVMFEETRLFATQPQQKVANKLSFSCGKP